MKSLSKILNEIVLTEGRVEDVWDKYKEYMIGVIGQTEESSKEKYNNDIVRLSSKINPNHKYLDFIVKRYVEDGDDTTLQKIYNAVSTFDRVSSNLEPRFRDIYVFNDTDELQQVLDDYFQEPRRKIKKLEGGEFIADEPTYSIVIPRTYNASCTYGAGTQWCVTSRDNSHHYENYTDGGMLFFILFKNKPTSDNTYKLAVHFDWGDTNPQSPNVSLWNVEDKQIADENNISNTLGKEIWGKVWGYYSKRISGIIKQREEKEKAEREKKMNTLNAEWEEYVRFVSNNDNITLPQQLVYDVLVEDDDLPNGYTIKNIIDNGANGNGLREVIYKFDLRNMTNPRIVTHKFQVGELSDVDDVFMDTIRWDVEHGEYEIYDYTPYYNYDEAYGDILDDVIQSVKDSPEDYDVEKILTKEGNKAVDDIQERLDELAEELIKMEKEDEENIDQDRYDMLESEYDDLESEKLDIETGYSNIHEYYTYNYDDIVTTAEAEAEYHSDISMIGEVYGSDFLSYVNTEDMIDDMIDNRDYERIGNGTYHWIKSVDGENYVIID